MEPKGRGLLPVLEFEIEDLVGRFLLYPCALADAASVNEEDDPFVVAVERYFLHRSIRMVRTIPSRLFSAELVPFLRVLLFEAWIADRAVCLVVAGGIIPVAEVAFFWRFFDPFPSE